VTIPFDRIAVIGAGAWGTALALALQRAGRSVTLWCRRPELAAAIRATRRNRDFLGDTEIPSAIAVTAALDAAAADAEAFVLAVPAQFLRHWTREIAIHARRDAPIVVAAKGIEVASGALMSDVVAPDVATRAIAILSGPSFAAEVARGLPTAVTLAAADPAIGQRLVASFGSASFRPYFRDDLVGVQVGGALKNVVAIACGIVVGKRLGENARAALIARGLAEMMRLAVALGGRAETLMGLSGLGDLALTCASTQSRNMSLGVALGEGLGVEAWQAGRRSITEGIATAAAVAKLAAARGIDMPIVSAVDAILHRGAAIDATIAALLARPFRSEN
jgi:glycerol-3-phosphate dehydrogenase (NAD(P)+)